MSTGKQTATQKTEPWGDAQPLMNQGMDAASSMFGQGMYEVSPYQWDRVAPQSGMTISGQDSIMNRAMGPNMMQQGAEGAINNATDMNQQYRYMDQVRDNVMDRVMPRVNDQFSGSGMAGGTLHSAAAADAATRALADVEYGAYGNAANRSLQAAGMAPGIDQMGYTPGMMMGLMGGQQDAYNQNLISADRDYWNETQNAPLNAVDRFSTLATGYGGMGGTTAGAQQYKPGGMDYLSLGLQMTPMIKDLWNS